MEIEQQCVIRADSCDRNCRDNDLIRRKDVFKFPIRRDHYDKAHGDIHFINGIETVMEYVEDIPAVDAVERGIFEQVAWERDIAIEQLADIGKSFGEKMDDVAKVVRCRECVFREDDGECTGSLAEATVPPEWFCAGGQRREDGNNVHSD